MCRFLPDPDPALAAYAHPERLVTADWLSGNLGRPGLAVVESDEDVLLYDTGHIPGAVKIDWHTDLNDPHVRDYINGEQFAELMDRKGISRDDTVVIYGDKSNWWAAYALWVFTLFGHPDVRLLDGGRDLWISDGRDTTLDVPTKQTSGYPGRRARRRTDPGVQGRRAGHPRQPAADRRALPAGVHRRAHPHARLPRGRRAARRAHPHRPLDPVGQGRPGQRPVPQPRRARRAVRLPQARRQDRRVLPHRRAVQPHLVRADAPARPARACATTTARGPSGATPCACPSSSGRSQARRHEHARATGRGGVGLQGRAAARTSCSCCWSSPASCRRCPPTSRRRRWSRCPNASRRCSCTSTPPTATTCGCTSARRPRRRPPAGSPRSWPQGLDEQSADDILGRARRLLHRPGPCGADQPAAAARHVGDAGPDQAPPALAPRGEIAGERATWYGNPRGKRAQVSARAAADRASQRRTRRCGRSASPS